MKYCAIKFEMGAHDHEIWQALLGEWPFDSLQDEENAVTGYIEENLLSQDLENYLGACEKNFFEKFSIVSVPDQNWNEIWESSFPPIEVDDFCYIRAAFHSPPTTEFKHVITIAPKMAFGTGHHATTYMMMRAMSKMNFPGSHILDFGCGTGLLSVVAAKEGAARVIGIDIQKEAIENSMEHAVINGVEHVCSFYLGELEKATESYDIILANIDRNTILSNLGEICDRMKSGSYLLVSGILAKDILLIENALKGKHLEIEEKSENGEWLQLVIRNKQPA